MFFDLVNIVVNIGCILGSFFGNVVGVIGSVVFLC